MIIARQLVTKMRQKDFYQILEVDYNAGPRAIQLAFHRMAKTYHPDKNPGDRQAEERFKQISLAYKTLSHPVRKSHYDLKLYYGTTTRTKYNVRRGYARARAYKTAKRTYTKRARILGGVSVVVILLVVLSISFLLIRYNSTYNFHRGLSNFQNQRFSAAYFNLKHSLGPLNPYQAAAHLLMADICFYQQADNNLTIEHLNKALEANPTDSIKARLYFLKGKVDYQREQYNRAYLWFEESIRLLPALDSAYWQLAEMDTFIFGRFQAAREHYNTLTKLNDGYFDAFIGLAYCNHHLGRHQEAIEAIDQSLTIRHDVPVAYYLKAISAQLLDQKSTACDNFRYAGNLGLQAAQDSIEVYCDTIK